MQNNLNDIVQRVRDIFPLSSAFNEVDFCAVERNLDIILPNDFIEINKMVRYDILSSDELLDFSADLDDWSGVIRNNLKLREKCSTDQKIQVDVSKILLLSFEEYGCIFMITKNSREQQTPVISCSYYDMYTYFVSGNFKGAYDEWPSFTAFFEYLVEQEEKKLKEED